MRLPVVSALFLSLALFTPDASARDRRDESMPADDQRAIIVLEGADEASFGQAVRLLEQRGARLTHRFPPDLAVGLLPPDVDLDLSGIGEIQARVERAGRSPVPGVVPDAMGAARAYLAGGRRLPGLPEPPPFQGDAVEPLPGDLDWTTHALPAGDCGEHPAPTSAFLAGSVAIGILLPESDSASPNTENWSNEDPAFPGRDRQDLVVAEIMEGCDTLVAQIPQAALSFSFDVRRSIPVGVEPILETVPSRGRWIEPILEAIGHGAASSSYGTHGYLNELRDRFGTDWAAAAYVADDLNDADNGFPPTGFPFAYALLGGPYMVMTYDNASWGLGRMDVVFRHELGHVFHALDEYRSAGNSCGNTSGMLGVKNGNNDSAPGDPDCVSAVPCVMRANSVPDACSFSLGQMGIRDTDGNGILDVRQAPPESGFEEDGPLISNTADLVLVARASGTPRRDEAGFVPAGASVNRIVAAEMSLDRGAWTPLPAADGSFGGRCEDLSISLSGLAEGWHSVELRATNDAGIVESTPAVLLVYVDTDCSDDASEPDDAGDESAPRAVGTHSLYHCAFDADWSRFHLQAGASVTLRSTQADTSDQLRLRLVDQDLRDVQSATAVGGIATVTAIAPWSGTYHAVVDGGLEFQTAYDLELIAACLDDPDEPDALLLTSSGSWRQRVLCAGDEDRYLVSMQAGESLAADISFDGALGNIDLELLDPTGAPVSTSAGTGSTESVSAAVTVEGTYVIRVHGASPADRGLYDLALTASGCLDDEGENDDDRSGARPVPGGAELRGMICGADEDWFAFDVAGRRLVRALLDHDAAAGNLDLELSTDSGRIVDRSTLTGGSEVITSERLAPGSYRLRVLGTSGARVPYRLRIQDEDPILLFVRKDATDAILGWNLSGQECFRYRRSELPSDFTGAVTEIVNEGDPSVPDGDRPIGDLVKRDRGVIHDGVRLYCYLIDPSDCGASLVGSVKLANPYPIVPPSIGSVPTIEYTIVVTNSGSEDAFGVTVTDDIPQQATNFTVLEIPPGSTDASAPAPAGAHGRGLITVTGINVPAGAERVVRFSIGISFNLIFESPVVSNQALVSAQPSSSGGGDTWATDDGATLAFPDDTRVYVIGSSERTIVVGAYWHRDVDIDLKVTDPCGNVLSEHDLTTASCGGVNSAISRLSSCAAPGFPTRFEQYRVWSWPSPGTYRFEVTYPGSLPGDPACGGTGPDDVTVVYKSPTVPYAWRTVTIAPGEPGAVVMTMTE